MMYNLVGIAVMFQYESLHNDSKTKIFYKLFIQYNDRFQQQKILHKKRLD